MRYSELIEAPRSWKLYRGRKHRLRLVRTKDASDRKPQILETAAVFGRVLTGNTEVFQGYYVNIRAPTADGESWLAEHPRSLYEAFQQACDAAEKDGWAVLAIGRNGFKETGLSANSGFGIHPAFPDRHVHMSEPVPDTD